jgi:maltose O-acetyltransferase
VSIDPSARITCDELVAGPGLIVRAGARIEGGRVVLGRNAFIDEHAVIGGGSAGDFTAGDHFHLGMFAQVNTARPVTVGDEVGLGIGTRIFTHGAYLSEWDGFPAAFESVTLGDRVWMPNAIVMPGVTVGSDVVVAAGSVVNRSLPSSVLVTACSSAKDAKAPAVASTTASTPPRNAVMVRRVRICRRTRA